MQMYSWAVWKNCRIAGYVEAYSEYDAYIKANNKYGCDIFLERSLVSANPTDLAGVAVVSETLKS